MYVSRFNVKGELGKTSYLTMRSLGRPYPTFTWTRADGKPLPRYINCTSVDWVSRLEVKTNDVTDFTDYNVLVSNYLGNYTATYTLYGN